VARVDYDREAERYHQGRQRPLGDLTAWRDAVARFLPNIDAPILDLGAGTGIWVMAFSTWFAKPVIALWRFFEAARLVANTFPTVEEVCDTFATAGFEMLDLLRVREPAFPSVVALRDWAVLMRHTDSALAPLSDEEFANGLSSIDTAIAADEAPMPLGVDLLVMA
jgi:hypothetical protein